MVGVHNNICCIWMDTLNQPFHNLSIIILDTKNGIFLSTNQAVSLWVVRLKMCNNLVLLQNCIIQVTQLMLPSSAKPKTKLRWIAWKVPSDHVHSSPPTVRKSKMVKLILALAFSPFSAELQLYASGYLKASCIMVIKCSVNSKWVYKKKFIVSKIIFLYFLSNCSESS